MISYGENEDEEFEREQRQADRNARNQKRFACPICCRKNMLTAQDVKNQNVCKDCRG